MSIPVPASLMILRPSSKNRFARQQSARRFNRRAAAFSFALATMLASALPFSPRAQAADTVVTVNNAATDLSAAASYTPAALPTATNDVEFTGAYTGGTTFNVNGAALTYGTLDDLDTTQALTISDTAGTPGTITLSSVANLTGTTGAANAADLLFVKSGANLTISTIGVTIGTATANNIDDAGTLNIAASSTLTLGSGTTSFTGTGNTTVAGTINGAGNASFTAGTVTLSGSNTFTGTAALTGGTLNLASTTALGSANPNTGNFSGISALTLSGGTINNTTGAAFTLGNNPTIALTNTTLGTATSTSANSLNLGAGAITMGGSGSVIFPGVGETLTLGGTFSATAALTLNIYTPSNTQSIANSASNTLVIGGGINLNSNAGATAATTLMISSNSNTAASLLVNGPVANGASAFVNNLTVAPQSSGGTYTFAGNNTYTGLTTLSDGTVIFSGNNSAATGSLTVSQSALNLANANALGTAATSTITMATGSINNTSGAAITLAGNPLISITNNFAFDNNVGSATSGANSINFGTGTALYNTNREIGIGGTNSTITFGGAFDNAVSGGAINLATALGNTLALGSTFALSNNTGTTAATFTFTGTGNVSVAGAVINSYNATANTGAESLSFSDPATLTLSGTNSYTGGTTLNGGTLVLDFSTNNTQKLSPTGVLLVGGQYTGSGLLNTIGGGTVNLSAGSFAQTVASTTLGFGADTFVQTNSGTSTLALGAITRNTGATTNFTGNFVTTTNLNATTPVFSGTTAASTTTSTGILGGYATFGGTTGSADWAATSATAGTNAPAAFTGYTAFVPGNLTAAAPNGDAVNPLLTGSSTLTGNVITNSLKIASATGSAQSLNVGTGQTLTLNSGGLLYTGSDAYSINGGTLRPSGTETAELFVQQYGSGTLTINSTITDGQFGGYAGTSGTLPTVYNASLVKAGPGTLVLGAANTYTGNTFINAGTLVLGVANAIPATGLSVGGTLNLNGFSQTVDALDGTGSIVNNGTATSTLTVGQLNTAGTFYGTINNGTGAIGLTKVGNNTLTLLGANTYSGPTLVAGGTLSISGFNGSIANSSSITVTGATLNVGDVNGPAGRINPALTLNLGGGNGGGNFNPQRIEGGVQALNVASLNVATGTSGLSNGLGTSADSGPLTITGASGSNYTRAAGSFITENGGGGDLSLSFLNPVTTGSSGVQGTPTTTGTAILIGSITSGSNSSFTGAAASPSDAYTTVSVPTAINSFTAAANIALTNTSTTTVTAATNTIGTATTINSLMFAAAGIAGSTTTLALNAPLTVSSGGILAGNMPITSTPMITGTGALQSGSAQDLWIYNNVAFGISAPIADTNANAATNDLTGGISKGGTGVLTLSGASTFAGPIYLTQGTLAIDNTNATGTSSALGLTTSTAPIYIVGGSAAGNATLQATGTALTTARSIVLGGGTNQNIIDSNGLAVTLNGVISSMGTQSTNVASGAGEIAFNSTVSGGTTTLTAANTFTGGTIVGTGSQLILGNSLALQNSTYQSNSTTTANVTGLVFSSAVASNAFTLGGLGNASAIALVNNASPVSAITLTIGNNNQNAASTGVLSGAGSLVKIGTGTQDVHRQQYLYGYAHDQRRHDQLDRN